MDLYQNHSRIYIMGEKHKMFNNTKVQPGLDKVINEFKNGNYNSKINVESYKGTDKTIADAVNDLLDFVSNKFDWYDSILDSLPFPVSVTDKDMNWTFLNKAVEDLAGLKRADMLGTQCNQWGATICNTKQCGICMLREGETTSFFEQPGEDNNFQVDTSYMHDANGEIVGHIEVIQDISASKQNAIYTENEIKRLVGNLTNIASGNLEIDSNIAPANEYTAEQHSNFAQIYSSLDEVSAAISGLIDDADMLSKAAVEGKLDARADVSKHEGDYRKVIEGVNSTLDAVIGPLNVSAEYIDRISKGDIPEKISDDYNGDFNEIKVNLNGLIDALDTFVEEMNHMSNEHDLGDIDVIIDENNFQGVYADMAKGVNDMVNGHISVKKKAMACVGEFSKGNYEAELEQFPGKKAFINETIEGLRGNVQKFIRDMNHMSEQHDFGDIDVVIPLDDFEGSYYDMAKGVNDMVNGHISVKKKAMACVKEFGEGNFEAELEQFPGKKAFINEIIEQVRSNLKALISDTDDLIEAAVEGKLDTRADASKHEGDFRKIVSGINDTLDAVIGPLNVTAEYVDRISKGDIPDKITDDYNGDFNEVKNNLNQCIDAINGLVDDANMLSDAAINGQFDTRADESKHGGKFRNIVDGVNGTLDTVVAKVNWYNSILDSIPIPISVTDNDLNWTFINKSAEEGTGLKREEVLGHQCSEWGAPICGTENCGVCKLNSGTPLTYFEIPGEDGVDNHMQVDTSFIYDSHGEKIGHIEVLQDISATKQNAIYTEAEIKRLVGNLKNIASGGMDIDSNIAEATKHTAVQHANFSQIYSSLDEVSAAISSLIDDADMLSKAAVEGKLGTRADASRHEGDYRKVVEGVNNTLDAVITPLNEASKVINEFAEGNLDSRFSIDAEGDFEELSNTLNEFGEKLQRMINDSGNVLSSIANNDLTRRIEVNGVGEFNQLTTGIEKCRLSLNEVVNLVKDNSEHLASSAQEISASTEQMTAGSEQISATVNEISTGTQSQSTKTEEVSRAMQDMNMTVQEVANSSQMASENAGESNDLIKGLGEISQDLILKMDSIKSASGDSAQHINDLAKKSGQIGEIVDLITNIADQTNLLALNAAIEAARAGEHGRGFAVVADEVRKLAEESGGAAKQIAELIHAMQEGTENAVTSMDQATAEVSTGSQSLEEAAVSINKVVQAGDDIARMVQEIAAAAEEQSASIEEVTSSVEEVSAVAEQSAAGTQEASASIEEQTASMHELSKSAEELAGLAANMESVVSKFNLDKSKGNTGKMDEELIENNPANLNEAFI